MTEEQFDSLNGRTYALSMTLTAIIQTLPGLAAAQAALALKIEQETELQADDENGTSEREASARDEVLGSYVELLSAVARNGG